MKYVAFTFDDGRSDNYITAKPIMDRYGFQGTVYVTTGFVDGTWKGKDVLTSPTRPLAIEEIHKLHESGWEIGLHGDQHQTQVDDMRTALSKLNSWGISNSDWGVSVPNSSTTEAEIASLLASEYGKTISYIRRGRKCDTSKMKNKLLYACYSVLKWKWAYRRFNCENSFTQDGVDVANIPCVVVKSADKPEWIIDFIAKLPDNSCVVLMLHSILSPDHPMCGKDPWSWENAKFDRFCAELKKMTQKGETEVLPLMELIKR